MKFAEQKYLLIVHTIFLICTNPLGAQTLYTFSLEPRFNVSGTSTFHEWEMTSDDASVAGNLAYENGLHMAGPSLVISMPVRSLKSNNGTLDENAWQALKAEEHPNIYFHLEKIENKLQLGNIRYN